MRMYIRESLICGCVLLTATVFSGTAFASCDDIRASIPSSRYTIDGDSVYDTETDLTWQRCSVGQTWSDGDGCSGEVALFTWNEATEQADGDWRLPTRAELESLISLACDPSVNPGAFPDMDQTKLWYWTGEAPTDGLAWSVYFDGGSSFNGYRTAEHAVRLVRDGQ
ncbi:MAG: DUF1566 domain-containing protein [Rhodospirillaceae bacterium]